MPSMRPSDMLHELERCGLRPFWRPAELAPVWPRLSRCQRLAGILQNKLPTEDGFTRYREML